MARGIHRLNTMQVARTKPKKDHAALCDGGGLYLDLTRLADGRIGRYFSFRYQRGGKRHEIGVGSVDTVTLAEARERARAFRLMLLDGKDPLTERQLQKAASANEAAAKRAEETKGATVGEVLDSYLALHKGKWSKRHAQDWEWSLRHHALPVIGDMNIAKVETPHVMKVIEPIWQSHRITAERIRGRIEKLIGFAAAKGLRPKGENPARWRGHLSEMLPSAPKEVKHLKAVPFEECPAVISRLRALDTVEACALEFVILTAARTDELLPATWSEVDFVKKVWNRPKEHMKGRKAHTVALSDRAVEILKSLPKSHADGFIFTRGDGVSALGAEVLLKLLKSGLKLSATVHGFRAS
jgi:integrase